MTKLSTLSRHGLLIIRMGSWICLPTLAYLSLVPDDTQLRTGAPGYLEHMIAYFGTAILFAVSYPRKRPLIMIALLGYAALLEVLQNLSPGRSPQVSDALASSAGAILGLLFVLWVVDRYWGSVFEFADESETRLS